MTEDILRNAFLPLANFQRTVIVTLGSKPSKWIGQLKTELNAFRALVPKRRHLERLDAVK